MICENISTKILLKVSKKHFFSMYNIEGQYILQYFQKMILNKH